MAPPPLLLQANCTGRSEPHTIQLAWSNFLRHPNCPLASLDDSAAEMVGELTMAPSAPPPSSTNLAESFLQITAISCRCLGGEVVGILETLFGLYSRNPVAKLGIRWESFKFAPFRTQLPLLCPLSHTVSTQCFSQYMYACNTAELGSKHVTGHAHFRRLDIPIINAHVGTGRRWCGNPPYPRNRMSLGVAHIKGSGNPGSKYPRHQR